MSLFFLEGGNCYASEQQLLRGTIETPSDNYTVRGRVSRLMSGLSLSALDTVDGETFNARAISLMVICGLFISMISIFSQR